METQVKVLGQRSGASVFLMGILAGILTNSVSATAHPIVQYWQNRTGAHEGFLLEPRVTSYSTSENYNLNGQATPFLPAATVTRLYFDVNASYGVTENFFLFGRLSLLNVKSSLDTGAATDQTAFGMADQLLGASYRVFSTPSGMGINLQAEVSVPAYDRTTSKTNNKYYLGDQSTDMTFGAFGEIPFNEDWYLEAGAGYTYRSRAFSAAVPLSLFVKRDPAFSGLTLSAGVRGQHSLSTDKTPIAFTESVTGSAGSYLIDGLNPSWMVVQGSLGYKVSPTFSPYVLVANSVSGTNAPKGIQVSIGATLDFGPSTSDSKKEKSDSERPRQGRRTHTHPNEFSSYNLDAKVVSVNDGFYLAKIDKGSDDGVEKGQIFDIFRIKEDSATGQKTETLIARAKVNYLKNDQAALGVIEYYIDQWIESGFTAKRLLQ